MTDLNEEAFNALKEYEKERDRELLLKDGKEEPLKYVCACVAIIHLEDFEKDEMPFCYICGMGYPWEML